MATDDFLVMSHDEAKLVRGAFEGMIRDGKGPQFARAFYDHPPEVRE